MVSQDLTGTESLDWCRATLEEHDWNLDTAARSALNMPAAELDRPVHVAEVRLGGGGGWMKGKEGKGIHVDKCYIFGETRWKTPPNAIFICILKKKEKKCCFIILEK